MARRFLTDRDRGYQKLLASIAAARGSAIVKVGIQGAEASAPAKGADGLDLVTLAAIHEFGLGVPERSFIRGWVDENRQMIEDTLRKAAQAVVTGKLSRERAMALMGLKFQASVQKRITDGIAPENAQSTIAAKGSSTPLVDTGQLKSAITCIVESFMPSSAEMPS